MMGKTIQLAMGQPGAGDALQQLPGLTGNGDQTGGDSTTTGVKNKPKLIVSNYTLSPEMPKAGQEFTLGLTFTNTNAYKSVRNIKIGLTSTEMSQGANGQQVAGGAVFSPVGSSNTFYIRSIAPEKSVQKEITLKTAPTIQAQNYMVSVSFEYEDLEGNEFTATESIGIPVVQTAQVLLGDLMVMGAKASENVPVALGQPVSLDLDMYNIGKDTLSTFMVSVEGSGFNAGDSPRRFIGNFAPGASDHFTAEITPTEPGMQATIKITYEDSTGEKHEETVPVSVQIEESMAGGELGVDPSKLIYDEKTDTLMDPDTGMHFHTETLEPVDPADLNKGLGPLAWIGLLVVLALVAVGTTLVLRRRRKKKQEQEMDLDA